MRWWGRGSLGPMEMMTPTRRPPLSLLFRRPAAARRATGRPQSPVSPIFPSPSSSSPSCLLFSAWRNREQQQRHQSPASLARKQQRPARTTGERRQLLRPAARSTRRVTAAAAPAKLKGGGRRIFTDLSGCMFEMIYKEARVESMPIGLCLDEKSFLFSRLV
ncbi:hypothetical protein H5410_062835 [Solanum commersonii]|uniref:Uncharacterized protein n=1 Tax=Solanum commersonii TaxID=4109 RepID=A0A9J5WC24_SOLCO|nr:hypothetical protein H5410_062835 [Solanum commersonii]